MDAASETAERVEENLRNNQQKAMSALTKALTANGYLDSDKHRVVAVTTWREWCEIAGIKDVTFRKMKQRLLERQLIVESGGTVRPNRG